MLIDDPGPGYAWPSDALRKLEQEAFGMNPPAPTRQCSKCPQLSLLTLRQEFSDGTVEEVCGDCADRNVGRKVS